MFRFIIESHTFKRVFAATVILIVLVFISDKLFDRLWGSVNSVALTNLDDVYNPPQEFDDIKKINLAFLPPDKVCIEGNMRLKTDGDTKDFSYVDTVKLTFPKETNEYTNRIYFRYENSKNLDSLILVTTKSDKPEIFWKQVFLSSVKVKNLNKIYNDTIGFRLDQRNLRSGNTLYDNDTLINLVLNYFNVNKDTLKLAECGQNSLVFKSICDIYGVPCRNIMLQGGDADIHGYDNDIGYPLHVVSEIYSSKFQKWYVIDPTYGLRFREKGTDDYINAVEISDKYFFSREKDIIQDSVLSTKRSLVGRDYFKYYENIYYNTDAKFGWIAQKFMQHLFNKFSYYSYFYSNVTPFLQNGKNYMIIKSVMYMLLLLIHVNFCFFVLIKRLVLVKKPKHI